MASYSEITRPERRRRPGTTPYRPSASRNAGPGSQPVAESRSGQEVLGPGTKVGRYEVVRLIGEGGMGTVYEAMDARLGRTVALKILSGKVKSESRAAKRFSLEARAAARLANPNAVAIYDFDIECQYPYIAMEYLKGETLAAAIARGPLAIDRLADIMLAVCSGVSEAHRAGVIHRDLKPSNIFLCKPAKGIKIACVLDFGISKVGGTSSSELTQTGDIVGTSQYLSPEQAAGSKQVTELSDIYSLGVVMYECVTQQTPQRGQSIYSLLHNVIEGRHVLAHEIRGDLAPAFESIIERAMMVKPTERYSSALELARAIFPFASAGAQRLFADFCGPAKALAQSGPAVPARATPAFALPATERVPAEPVAAWRRSKTRTSLRRSAERPTDAALVVGGGPSWARKTIVSVALGAVLAAAVLLGVSLFL
jgi:eukaryotic-like serine/threonine-protein kinase